MKNLRLLTLLFAAFLTIVLIIKTHQHYFTILLLLTLLLLSRLITNEAAKDSSITSDEAENQSRTVMPDGDDTKSTPFPILRCLLAFFCPFAVFFAYFGPKFIHDKSFVSLAMWCIIPSTTFLVAALPDGHMTEKQKILKKLRVGGLIFFWGLVLFLFASACDIPMRNRC